MRKKALDPLEKKTGACYTPTILGHRPLCALSASARYAEFPREERLNSLRSHLVRYGLFPPRRDPETAPITMQELKGLKKLKLEQLKKEIVAKGRQKRSDMHSAAQQHHSALSHTHHSSKSKTASEVFVGDEPGDGFQRRNSKTGDPHGLATDHLHGASKESLMMSLGEDGDADYVPAHEREEERPERPNHNNGMIYLSRGFADTTHRVDPRSPEKVPGKHKKPNFDLDEDGEAAATATAAVVEVEEEDTEQAVAEKEQQMRVKRKCSNALLNMSCNETMQSQFIEQGGLAALLSSPSPATTRSAERGLEEWLIADGALAAATRLVTLSENASTKEVAAKVLINLAVTLEGNQAETLVKNVLKFCAEAIASLACLAVARPILAKQGVISVLKMVLMTSVRTETTNACAAALCNMGQIHGCRKEMLALGLIRIMSRLLRSGTNETQHLCTLCLTTLSFQKDLRGALLKEGALRTIGTTREDVITEDGLPALMALLDLEEEALRQVDEATRANSLMALCNLLADPATCPQVLEAGVLLKLVGFTRYLDTVPSLHEYLAVALLNLSIHTDVRPYVARTPGCVDLLLELAIFGIEKAAPGGARVATESSRATKALKTLFNLGMEPQSHEVLLSRSLRLGLLDAIGKLIGMQKEVEDDDASVSSQGSRPGKPRKRRHKASKDKQPAQAHDGNSAQHLCAMLLHVLTTNQDNHDALLGGGAVLLLVKLSQSPNEVTKTACTPVAHEAFLGALMNLSHSNENARVLWCAWCFANVSTYPKGRAMLGKLSRRLVPTLLAMMRAGCADAERIQYHCAVAMCNTLSVFLKKDDVIAMLKEGTVQDVIVITVLRANDVRTKQVLAQALFNLLARVDTRAEMIRRDVPLALVRLTKVEDPILNLLCVNMLKNLSCEAETLSQKLLEMKVVCVMVDQCLSPSGGVQIKRRCASTLGNLSRVPRDDAGPRGGARGGHPAPVARHADERVVALCNLVVHYPESRENAVQMDLMPALQLVRACSTDAQYTVLAKIVRDLTKHADGLPVLAAQGAMALCVRLAKREPPTLKHDVATAVCNLCSCRFAPPQVIEEGAVSALFWLTLQDCLNLTRPIFRECSIAVRYLAQNAALLPLICMENNLLPLLLRLAKFMECEDTRYDSAVSLYHILGNEPSQKSICRSGAVKVLTDLAATGTRVREVCSAALHQLPNGLLQHMDGQLLSVLMSLLQIHNADFTDPESFVPDRSFQSDHAWDVAGADYDPPRRKMQAQWPTSVIEKSVTAFVPARHAIDSYPGEQVVREGARAGAPVVVPRARAAARAAVAAPPPPKRADEAALAAPGDDAAAGAPSEKHARVALPNIHAKGAHKFMTAAAVDASGALQMSTIRAAFRRDLDDDPAARGASAADAGPGSPAKGKAAPEPVKRKQNPRKYLVAKKMKQKDRISDDYYELLRHVA
ncbi:hypothetical protein JL721_7602 [Aureococcus anophagefferens]|nr:hypothetical protein JL721_7602 [Aureococcus anophagefferens]